MTGQSDWWKVRIPAQCQQAGYGPAGFHGEAPRLAAAAMAQDLLVKAQRLFAIHRTVERDALQESD